MSNHIKDGYYVEPFKKLKFKGDTIQIPCGTEYGNFLSYDMASKEYVSTLKKHYQRSGESLAYQVENMKVVRVDTFENLLKKLKLPPLQEKISEKDQKTPHKSKKHPSKSERQKTRTHKPKPTSQPNQNKKPKKLTGHRKRNFTSENVNGKDDKAKTINPPTIQNVARYFSIFPSEVIHIFQSNGIEGLDAQYLLSKSQYEWLKKKIISDPTWKSKRISLPTYIWTEFREEDNFNPTNQPQAPSNIKIESPTEVPGVLKHLALFRDVFNKKVKNVRYLDLDTITSYFTDSQAQLICSRMCSSYARSIAEKYSKARPGEDMDLLLYQLHYMANRALQVFGGKILTLIYELPSLRFAQRSALEVRTYKNVRPDFPMISFQTNQVQVNVAFFTKLHPHRNQVVSHVILFKHMTYETIGSIDVLGYIRLKLTSFRPILSLFIDRINEKQYKIYSGVQTGVCDICNRPLKHPLSLRIGIGPVCAREIGLDRSVYDY